MPWQKVETMNLKLQLVTDRLSRIYSKKDLADKYKLSRKTVHKWISRYDTLGVDGLKDQSRRPHHNAKQFSDEIVQLAISEKLKNIKRVPRKVRAQLMRANPKLRVPASSTMGLWFKKESLVRARPKTRWVAAYSKSLTVCTKPNQVWCVDYKGYFKMQNRKICYPLTVTDNFSRYLLGCKALPSALFRPTQKLLRELFLEFGVPEVLRSDNGTPFASSSIGGLSQLMVWLIEHGIVPERIQKGRPDQNGRHERMHKTLKLEALETVSKNLFFQQRVFDYFRFDYNQDRPHQALADRVPQEVYQHSAREFKDSVRAPFYDFDQEVRQVHLRGEFKFKGKLFFLSRLLSGKPIALRQINDQYWQIDFYFYTVALLDSYNNIIINQQKV